MRCILNITINDKVEEPIYEYDNILPDEEDVYHLYVTINSKTSLKDILADKESIRESVEEENESYNLTSEFNEYHIDDISFIDTFENDIEYINLTADNADIIDGVETLSEDEEYSNEDKVEIVDKYLNNHSEFREYVISIPNTITPDTDLDELSKKYDGYKGVLIKPDNAYKPITVGEAKKAETIYRLIENIKSMGLTPLEQAILVYDIVREKPYLLGDNIDPRESREIYSIVDNDKIVCAGYANLYKEIMTGLGIPCEYVVLDALDGGEGHARCIVRIDDPEYGLKMIGIVDPTMDHRREGDYTSWLYSYHGFMRKPDKKLDEFNGLKDNCFEYYFNHNIDDLEDMEELKEEPIRKYTFANYTPDVIIQKMNEDKVRRHFVDNMLSLYGYDNIYDRKEKYKVYMNHQEDISECIKNKLNLSTFMKALIRVRVMENKINPKKYPLDEEKLYTNTYDYGFKEENRDKLISTYLSMSTLQEVKRSRKLMINKNMGKYNIKYALAHAYHNLCAIERLRAEYDIKEGRIKVVDSIKLYDNQNKEK